MGSLNDFWSTAQRAEDFLNTGFINDTVRNAGYETRNETRNEARNERTEDRLDRGYTCFSTSQCPSGWGCVGGVCAQLNSGSNDGISTPGGGSDCDPDNPQSPCNSGGPNSCQQTPQCGDDSNGRDEARECCNNRCCTFGSASSSRPGVHCFCGDCPDLPGCSSFCDSYLKANGEGGPGCREGFDGNSCGGCTECDNGECRPITLGAPCYCENSECDAQDCQKCDTDEESLTFGQCLPNPDGCQDCATITNHRCPCGVVLPPITACVPHGKSGPTAVNTAQDKAATQCEEECDNLDPCAPLVTTFLQCAGDDGPATCPPGSTQTGVVEAGGQECAFCKIEDSCSTPASCPENKIECHCHDDCPDCEFCNSTGSCQREPVCDICDEGEQVCSDLETCCGNGRRCIDTYSNVFQTSANTFETYVTLGPIQWEIVEPFGQCGAFDCNGNTTTEPTLARNRLAIYNYRSSNSALNGCTGILQCLAYRDPLCNWDGGPFDPVLISSEIIGTSCCTPESES